MRINRFVAAATGMSRRRADQAIAAGNVLVNAHPASTGQVVAGADIISWQGKTLRLPPSRQTILLNKPIGYICSRAGQGSQTIYELLPAEFHELKPVGRLDKDSSGLLLLTNDGQLAHQLTHPKFQKEKVYEVKLDKPLTSVDKIKIEKGIQLQDGLSRLALASAGKSWIVTMSEGRNRQIRRSFAALGYEVTSLHRTKFGSYRLATLKLGDYRKTGEQ